MAEEKKTVYPDTRLIVGLIIGLFALVYLGAAWFPETVKIIFNVKQGESQFAGFGTIGDFFGGVINPILTFITIYLLLVSIRIQREELEATREEMKESTDQSEKSNAMMFEKFELERALDRPFLRLFKDDNVGKFGYLRFIKPGVEKREQEDEEEQEGEEKRKHVGDACDLVTISANFFLINVGKSPCRVVDATFRKIIFPSNSLYSKFQYHGYKNVYGYINSEIKFPLRDGGCGIVVQSNKIVRRSEDYILPGETFDLSVQFDESMTANMVFNYYWIMGARSDVAVLGITYENLVGHTYYVEFDLRNHSVSIEKDGKSVKEVDELFSYEGLDDDDICYDGVIINNYFNSAGIVRNQDHLLETGRQGLAAKDQKNDSATTR